MLSAFLYNIILTLSGLQPLSRFCNTDANTCGPKPTHLCIKVITGQGCWFESMILKKMRSVTEPQDASGNVA